RRRRRRLLPLIIIVGVVIGAALAALVYYQPWDTAEKPAKTAARPHETLQQRAVRRLIGQPGTLDPLGVCSYPEGNLTQYSYSTKDGVQYSVWFGQDTASGKPAVAKLEATTKAQTSLKQDQLQTQSPPASAAAGSGLSASTSADTTAQPVPTPLADATLLRKASRITRNVLPPGCPSLPSKVAGSSAVAGDAGSTGYVWQLSGSLAEGGEKVFQPTWVSVELDNATGRLLSYATLEEPIDGRLQVTPAMSSVEAETAVGTQAASGQTELAVVPALDAQSGDYRQLLVWRIELPPLDASADPAVAYQYIDAAKGSRVDAKSLYLPEQGEPIEKPVPGPSGSTLPDENASPTGA
ncbi:MAG TPA: hypothetical protein VFC59_03190, partial [Cryobacterium sp.]|nr:hypothetical protein [Cryobacterium sp.]